jgi:GT2 family glycosyltransferase
VPEPLPVYLIHYNAPGWVASSARSILESDIPVALTIVDNGPPGATAKLDLPRQARVLTTRANLGYSGGANAGLRHWLAGEAGWCVVGSHDLHVARDAIRRLVEAGERAPSYGIVGPGTQTFPTDHGEGVYWNGERLGASEGLEERTGMSGTCLLLRRECILEIGLFDEQFGSYGEDVELCIRARRHGWKVGRATDVYAQGLGSSAPNHAGLRERALILLALKTRGRLEVLRRLMGQARRLLRSLLLAWLPTETGRARRADVARHWYGLSRGLPVLWARSAPPKAGRGTPIWPP